MDENNNLLNDITNAINKYSEVNFKKGSNLYKPSCLNCMRQMYYIRKNYDCLVESSDYQGISMAATGTYKHEFIQNILMNMPKLGFDWEYVNVAEYVKEKQKHGKCLNIEIKDIVGFETHLIDTELNTSFRCDGILRKISTNEYYLFEFKNVISFKFNRILDKALDDHYKQVICYCTSLDLDKAFIVYENRDTCELKIPEIVYNSTVKKEALRQLISTCENYVNNNQLPPKISNTKYCRWCSYKNLCNKEVV